MIIAVDNAYNNVGSSVGVVDIHGLRYEGLYNHIQIHVEYFDTNIQSCRFKIAEHKKHIHQY